MLHTKEGFRLIPGPGPQAMSSRCRLGPAGRAAKHGGENETTAAIAGGRNAARGSPDTDNHKYEASLRTPAPITPQAGAGAAAAPPGAHGTKESGARSAAAAARLRLPPPPPGQAAQPPPRLRAGTPAGFPGRSLPAPRGGRLLPSARERISDTVFCTAGIAWAAARPPPSNGAPCTCCAPERAAARPGARAAGPDGGGSSGSPRRRLSPPAPLSAGTSPRWRRRCSLTAAAPALRTRRPPPEPTNSAPPPRLPVPRRPAAISPSPGLGLLGSPRLTGHRHYGGVRPATGASEGPPMRPPPREAGGMERAEPWAAARRWGRAGEAPGKVARCLRQPRRAAPTAGRGERGPARRVQPGGLAEGQGRAAAGPEASRQSCSTATMCRAP